VRERKRGSEREREYVKKLERRERGWGGGGVESAKEKRRDKPE